jgi:hypothetical protein
MRAFRRVKLDLQQRHSDQEEQYFIRLLKETQQWRLNFGYPTYRDRFRQVGRLAVETYIKHLPEEIPASRENAVADFVKVLYELMTDWGAPLVKSASA